MTRARHLAALGLALAAALAAPACSPVVGASCALGRVVCAGRCVELATDPAHCGACDRVCAPGASCVARTCVASGDAGSLDAGGPDAGRLDADALDALAADVPTATDGGGSDATSTDVGPLDAPPADGAAGDATGRDAPGVDAGPPCVPPTVFCAGLCVDLDTDPEHCGACGVACPSGLCVARACVGGPAGHLVLVGHDYETSRVAMQRVVGNAVFLARTSPVRVLAFEGDTTARSRAGTDAAIDSTGAALGRTWSRTVAASAADVPSRVASFDVLLVYAQAGATNGVLRGLGASWRASLSAFLDGGGIVVVLETASAANAGTWQILDAAGLLSASGVTDVSLSTLAVAAPGDAVALGVPLSYRGERTTVRITTTDGVAVVVDGTGAPVVVHRTVSP